MKENYLLSLSDVSLHDNGRVILHNFNLDVLQGEIIGLFGRNGTGQSDLLRLVEGSILNYSGEISKKCSCRFVSDTRSCFHGMSVRENLEIIECFSSNSNTALVNEFPFLNDHMDQKAETLSGGEQQILAILMALVSNVDLLLIEQFSQGLQPSRIRKLIDIIHRLRDNGTSMVIYDDSPEVLARLCNKILLFKTPGKPTLILNEGGHEALRTLRESTLK